MELRVGGVVEATMRTLPTLVLLSLAACHKPPATFSDALLTDAATEVEASTPRAILEGAAASTDPTPRARALHWLLRSEPDDAWMTVARFDASPWVQLAAVDALATRADPDTASLRPFVQQDDGDPMVRLAAALALPGPDEAAREASSAAWRASSAPWDRAPLALAAHVHGDAEAAAPLLAAVATGELPLDLRLVRALADEGPPGMSEALRQAQSHAPEELAVALAAAQLALGDDQGEAPLRDAMSDDAAQRMEGLDALMWIEHPAVDGLIRRARQGASPLVTWHADLLLAARRGSDSQRFSDAMQAADPEVRRLAIQLASYALTRSSDSRRAAKDARRALLDGLTDDDAAVRGAAARAGGELRVLEGEAALEALLVDDSPAVRLEAAGALTALLTPPRP